MPTEANTDDCNVDPVSSTTQRAIDFEDSKKQSFNSQETEQESCESTEEVDLKFTDRKCSRFSAAVDFIKYSLSFALIAFSVAIIGAAIFSKQTVAASKYGIPPFFAFLIFWVLLLWLAMLEGALNCMVGLEPIDKTVYATSHPKTYRCTRLAHKGDNLERFIVGRQYLDLSIVFMTSIMVSTIDGATVWGLPQQVIQIFFGSGVAVILITVVFGQLVSVINATHCMIDFVNNHVVVASTYVALTVEASGILHAVYLIQIIVTKLTGSTIKSNEAPRSCFQKVLFWARVIMSTVIVVLGIVVTLVALFQGKTTAWKNLPPYVSVVILIVLILVGGMMEGMQIASFAVKHMPTEELSKHPQACKMRDFFESGHTLQAFLIGRQMLQTAIMFVIAKITTLDSDETAMFGLSDGFHKFLSSGVLGALMSTILASLCWRILAATFPIFFLSNRCTMVIVRLCLFIEGTGVCSFAWILAAVHYRLVGYTKDEVYIAAAESKLPDVLEVVEGGQFPEDSIEKIHDVIEE